MKVPIYRARMMGDRRMIYQIDCISDSGNNYGGYLQEVQAIRIFGIFTLEELHRRHFWNTLSHHSQQRGSEYIKRCTLQSEPQLNPDDIGIVLPARFSPLPEQDGITYGTSSSIDEEEMKEIHSSLVLDKFTVLSQPVLNSIKTDKLNEIVQLPPLSAQEWEIVEHLTSCYVIGRSGTGKTTTMLLKMLGRHRVWEEFPDMGPRPRQAFVTQSPALVKKVKKYFTKLMSVFGAAFNSPAGIHVAGEDPKQETDPSEQEDGLIGQEYAKRWGLGLPDKYSDLRDDHFPLFITYDQLCAMLENDIGRGGRSHHNSITPTMDPLTDEDVPPTNPIPPRRARRRAGPQFVSYKTFVSSYWNHFPQSATRKLDPVLVFREFVGVIKGSENTIATKDKCLDRESYTSLSTRSQGTFSHKRDEIYDLFETYQRRKGLQGDYDAADRTHSILEALRDRTLAGRKLDYLYVDEAQDHLIIDTRVLRMICANPHGLFWAGDTAQTISMGSSFRFADLKAYQHRIERQLSCGLGLIPVEPRVFELVQNHRSHSGIVNCARSVVELIIRYWPQSIDTLKPERTTTPGFRPIFFACRTDEDLIKAFFTDDQGEDIDLGANQCVLVRSDETKARLRKKFPVLGRNNFVTLHDSKGLEFNDVILYNFFEESTATANQWRLVLNDVSDGYSLQRAPIFDEALHGSLCMELKSLYVAITRARHNLWIADSSESAGPMKVYWSSIDQLTVWPPTTKMPKLAVESNSSEDWSTTASTMFENGNYADAAVAFRRADRERKAKICDAYVLQEKAGLTSATFSATRIQAFMKAANAFVDCAGDSKHTEERLTCYEVAGDCYMEARDPKKAADNYLLAELYDQAALAYQEGGRIDRMVGILDRHKDDLDGHLHARSTTVARMYYFKRLDTKAALKLFPTVEEALEFVRDLGLDEPHSKLLTELGKDLEAAAIHAKRENWLRAIEILAASPTRRVEHIRQAIQYLLTGLWRSFAFGTTTASSKNSARSRLLGLVDRLGETAKTEQGFDEVVMFQATQRADHAMLRTLAKTFIEARKDVSAIVCLDHVFSSPLELQNLPIPEIRALLTLYLDYIRLLNRILRDTSLSGTSNRKKLFGFRALGEGHWLVPKRTLLYGNLIKKGSSEQSDDGYRCGSEELRRGINEVIYIRIINRTKAQNNACRKVHGFSPCLRLLFRGECSPPDKQESCPFQHIRPRQLTIDWYHARLRLILLQFKIIDGARCRDPEVVNYWLGILYSALHPPFHKLGSFARLEVSRIPEADDGLRVVQQMVRGACHEQVNGTSADRSRQRFIVACTLAFDLDRRNALSFIHRTPAYRSRKLPQSQLCQEGGQVTRSVVQDFVAFLGANEGLPLTSGSWYLRGVLRQKLRVDLNTLCDLAERLSGLFIIARSRSPREGVLHNVVLPRSWFINIVRPKADPVEGSSSIPEFVADMIDLMRRVDAQVRRYLAATSDTNGEEQFYADGMQVTEVTGALYIARICLCLCLIVYNNNNVDLREKVLAGFRSLREMDGKSKPWADGHYANAENWDDMIGNVFMNSLKDSPFEELILFPHADFPTRAKRLSRHIRIATYNRFEEVPKLLSMTPHLETPPETSTKEIGSQAEDSVPGDMHDSDHDGPEEEGPLEQNEVQVNAAKTIQAAYRRYLKRGDIVPDGIDAPQAHYWQLLRERSREMQWPKDSQYYILFRVPLGFVLVCLDAIGRFFESEKKKAKKQMSSAKRVEMETAEKALTKHSELLKRTIELQKRLSPTSAFHNRRSVDDLQQAVLEVGTLVKDMSRCNTTGSSSSDTMDGIRERWDQGSKWIFEKARERSERGEGR